MGWLSHHEEVMGTVVSFDLLGAPGTDPEAALVAACAELHRVDREFSTYRGDSPVSRLRRGEWPESDAPAELTHVLELCRRARELTAGFFDPWALPGGVDPSGLVKGWAVQQAVEILAAGGVRAAIVNGGGDISIFGPPPAGPAWRIGIRHPWRADALAAVLECDGGAVATSATYERGEHLINPFTRASRTAVASATVLGPDLTLADAFATALAVAGPALLPRLAELSDGYDAHLIAWDGTEHTTAGVRIVPPQELAGA
ncbi:MAG TPA: FAD:protein FMN transferase [Solirubrobacteraceae bacterium]|nr:FAD:protein FMN transferase [Solirubrobacteraceae bacterium]